MNIQGENKSRNNLIGLLPLWIVMGVFMIGPLIVMAFVSIMESNSYGGIHLKFENASDLGNDSSGNNNDYTANNLDTDHQVLDSPTFGS